ncbi:MAG: DUF1640 domain-containing protein [candidate division NC10 bacterium]|nr:DUF1640 domain-containing protein [candidate division NC10 bacterium]
MEEQARVLELAVSQLDKRLATLEQSFLQFRAEVASEFGQLRGEMSQFRGEMSQLRGEVASEFGQLRAEMSQFRGEVASEFGQLRAEMSQSRGEVFAQLRELRAEIRSNFRWTITTMITLFGIAIPAWMLVLGYIIKRL